MSYVGNTNTTQAFTAAVDYFSGNGSTVAFTLSRPVASTAQVQVVVNNVPQNPTDAFTVLNNTITFTSAPSSGTNNIYVQYTSPITQVIQPGQGTVTSNSFGVITDFTTTGNTVLGNASTDTLNVGNGGLVKDASGNVGIGTSSPGAKLEVKAGNGNQALFNNAGERFTQVNWQNNGTNKGAIWVDNTNSLFELYGYSGIGMTFSTNGSERARIDSSGNLLVAKSTTADTTVGAGMLSNGRVTSSMSNSTGSESTLHVYSTGASAYRFYVTMAGNVFATSTTITGISDQRLKENIRDLEDGLASVMALQPRKFDWKEGKGADIKNARGFIAQEFENVFPDLIDEWKDPAPEGEKPYKSVRADLIPVLVKAIQEQQAIITALTARVAALENK